jgi:UDP-MurNAc hydroxylase
MKIKLYRSATVGVILENYKILLDPWLTDGEYFGSWSHYPHFDFEKNLDEINSYDCIYVSHIHPDHCSEETLKKIDNNIPIYIHTYHEKFLKNKIERLGFKTIELENNKRTQIAKNVYLNILAADNCNPELCYKFIGCRDSNISENNSLQLDTISLIDDGKNVLMNVNDCPIELSKSTFNDIKKQYKYIDILLTGYGGAGPYPQCFENLDLSEKKTAAEKKKNQFLSQAKEYIDEFKPNYYLPFAGTYTLTGKLSNLKDLRGQASIDEAYSYFEDYYLSQNLSDKIKPLKLNLDATFDLTTKMVDLEYKKLDEEKLNSYIKEKLSHQLFSYEKDDLPSVDEIYELSKKAHLKFLDKILIHNVIIKSDIFIKINEVKSLMLGLDKKLSIIFTNEIDKKSTKYVVYQTDIRLLKRLLMGPKFAHWNNAEIGSHIKFFRKPNKFERDLHFAICYFHS